MGLERAGRAHGGRQRQPGAEAGTGWCARWCWPTAWTNTSDGRSSRSAEGQALQVQRSAKRRRLHHAHLHRAGQQPGVRPGARGLRRFTWNADPTALGVECTTYGLDPLPAGATVVQIWNSRAWAALYDPTAGATFLFRLARWPSTCSTWRTTTCWPARY